MIKTIDGHDIVYEESKINSKKIALLCHGITSSKDEGGFFIELSEELEKNGFNTIRFDFRGHGESKIASEDATIAGMLIDLNTILNYLYKKYDGIYIVAASFGASILLLLSQKVTFSKVRKVALLNPVTNYETTFTSTNLPWGKSFFPQEGLNSVFKKKKIVINNGKKFEFNPEMALEFYYYQPYNIDWDPSIPMSIFHGTKDQIVSIEDSKKFVQKQLSKSIKLIELYRSSHGLEEEIDKVFGKLISFLGDK